MLSRISQGTLVVICLKTRTFAVSQTTGNSGFAARFRLWFAWKLVLLQYRKQPGAARTFGGGSCDLLENSYFCSIANNFILFAISSSVLWFAWKLVLLQYRKQLTLCAYGSANCCDLLENSYFCSIANNQFVALYIRANVVICLKTRTFAVSQTTVRTRLHNDSQLWFAWKLVLLQYRKQLIRIVFVVQFRCDLLENSYFCSIANNYSCLDYFTDKVVICLKTRTFAVSQTTHIRLTTGQYQLWFAWKLVLLQYRKQRLGMATINNLVVICLKTRTFAVSQTTNNKIINTNIWLWFAWKLVLLQYRKQQKLGKLANGDGCDLLENSYFCSIANNSYYQSSYQQELWFAWKLVLLQYRKQHKEEQIREKISCDLLENSYFCSIANNHNGKGWNCPRVVICLKTRTFAVSQTT